MVFLEKGVILISIDGQIVQANHAAEHILGLMRSSIEERNYISPEWEIFRPDGTSMPLNEMAGPRAMKEKRLIKNIVMGVKHPDKTIRWINVSAAPFLDEDNKIIILYLFRFIFLHWLQPKYFKNSLLLGLRENFTPPW